LEYRDQENRLSWKLKAANACRVKLRNWRLNIFGNVHFSV
jgi:hypothetical protein